MRPGDKTPMSLELSERTVKPLPIVIFDDGQRIRDDADCSTLSNQQHFMIASSTCPSEPPPGMKTRRFVAGDVFFNYEAEGSLRPDLPPIQLFSPSFFGLAVNTFFAGFVLTFVKSTFHALLVAYLRVFDKTYVSSVQFMHEWPTSFVLFVGLLSDCRPIQGHRRKPYMVIGWLVAAASFVLVALVDFSGASSWEVLSKPKSSKLLKNKDIISMTARYGEWLLLLMIIGLAGLQVMFMITMTLTVEFAQREPLNGRGRIQATIFVIYYLSTAVAQGASVLFVLNSTTAQSSVSLGTAALIIAVACMLPVPMLRFFLEEPTYKAVTVHLSVRRRVSELWRFCHHNVVIRVVAFLALYFFFDSLYNQNSRRAIQTWTDYSSDGNKTWGSVADSITFSAALILWSSLMVNWSWRRVVGYGTAVAAFASVICTVFVVYDIYRASWFYIVYQAVLDMPRCWAFLFTFVLSTEIADSGREGVTVGLLHSIRAMVTVMAQRLSTPLGQGAFFVSDKEIAADDERTRAQVLGGSFVVIAINTLAVFTVLLLPNQRLDAQQLRAFGGFNRYASLAIAIVFTSLVFTTSILNIMAIAK